MVQAIEARTGAAIIGIGFALQAIAQFTPSPPIAHIWLLPVLIIALALSGFFALQRRFVSKAAQQAAGFYDALEAQATNEDWRRELMLRRDELRTIAGNPQQWLKPQANRELPDKTLPNEKKKEQKF